MADYPDWQTPAAAAAQIAAAGVPLLTRSQTLYPMTTTAAPPGEAPISAVLPVSQTGYELFVTAQVPAAATAPFLVFKLVWSDSVTGQVTASDHFMIPAATVAGAYEVVGRGPTKGDQVQLRVGNIDPAQVIQVKAAMLQNSRIYGTDQWQTLASSSKAAIVPGYTLPTMPDNAEVLGTLNAVNVPAASAMAWLIPMGSARPALLTMNTTAAAPPNIRVDLFPAPAAEFGISPPLGPGVPATPDFAVEFIAPFAPMLLQVTNNQATAITVSATVIQQQ